MNSRRGGSILDGLKLERLEMMGDYLDLSLLELRGSRMGEYFSISVDGSITIKESGRVVIVINMAEVYNLSSGDSYILNRLEMSTLKDILRRQIKDGEAEKSSEDCSEGVQGFVWGSRSLGD